MVGNPWIKLFIHSSVITFLTWLLIYYGLSVILSQDVFTVLDRTSDFKMTDVYQYIDDSSLDRCVSESVVVVGMDGGSRDSIAQTIRSLHAMGASAIGVDFLFPYHQNSRTDSLLLQTLRQTPNVVLASVVRNNSDDTFEKVDGLIMQNDPDLLYGIINLPPHSNRGIIRTIRPYFNLTGPNGVVQHPAFSTMLASLKDSSTTSHLQSRLSSNNQIEEDILFSQIEIESFSFDSLLHSKDPYYADCVKGKVVLLGDLHNKGDMFLTPIKGEIPGVIIHAYAINMILSGKFISHSPALLDWLMAIFLCWLFSVCNLLAKWYTDEWGNFIMRIVQLVTMFIFLFIGCKWYMNNGSYLDFTCSILMVGISSLSFDLWCGLSSACVHLFLIVKSKIACLK